MASINHKHTVAPADGRTANRQEPHETDLKDHSFGDLASRRAFTVQSVVAVLFGGAAAQAQAQQTGKPGAPAAKEPEALEYRVGSKWVVRDVFDNFGRKAKSQILLSGVHLTEGDALNVIIDAHERLHEKNPNGIPKSYRKYLVTTVNGRQEDEILLPRFIPSQVTPSDLRKWLDAPGGSDAIGVLRSGYFLFRGGKTPDGNFSFESAFGYDRGTKNPTPVFYPNGKRIPNSVPNTFKIELRKE